MSTEMKSGFKIMSWNINGMRTLSMKERLDQLNCTILCVQETKLSRNQLEESQALINDYTSYFSFSKNRAGYSGVATYCHNDLSPTKSEEGLTGVLFESSFKSSTNAIGEYCLVDDEELSDARYGDMDGRTIITQHTVQIPGGEEKLLNVINVYCPRLRDDPADQINNTNFKLAFHSSISERAKNLIAAGQFVLIVGDLNVCHKLIDQCDIDDPTRFHQTMFREWLNDLLDPKNPNGFQDSFRTLHPTREGAFTCWCTRLNARQNNYGARIDFILGDKHLMKYLDKADIHPDVLGSDHCPVSATFHSLALVPCDKIPPSATKHYPEFSGKQQTLKELFKKCQKRPMLDSSQESHSDLSPQSSKLGQFKNMSKVSKPKQTNLISFFGKKPKLESEIIAKKITEKDMQDNSIEDNNLQISDPVNATGFFKEVNSTASHAWRQLLKTPTTPLCAGHNELSVIRTVKKKGPHQGRQFWACARGTGKSDDPNANCNFFQWANSKA